MDESVGHIKPNINKDGNIEVYKKDDIDLVRYKKEFLETYKFIRFIDIKHDFYGGNEKYRSILTKEYVDNVINKNHQIKSKKEYYTNKNNEIQYQNNSNAETLKGVINVSNKHKKEININIQNNDINFKYETINEISDNKSNNKILYIEEPITKDTNIYNYINNGNLLIDTTKLGSVIKQSTINLISDRLDSSLIKNQNLKLSEEFIYEFPLYIKNKELVSIMISSLYDKLQYRFRYVKNYIVDYNDYTNISNTIVINKSIDFSVAKISNYINNKYNSKKGKFLQKIVSRLDIRGNTKKYNNIIDKFNKFIVNYMDITPVLLIDILFNFKVLGDQSRIFDTYYINYKKPLLRLTLMTIDTYLFNYALLTKSISVCLNNKQRKGKENTMILYCYNIGDTTIETIDYDNVYNKYNQIYNNIVNNSIYKEFIKSSNHQIDILYKQLINNTDNRKLFIYIILTIFKYLDFVNLFKTIEDVESFKENEIDFYFKSLRSDNFIEILKYINKLKGNVEEKYDQTDKYTTLLIELETQYNIDIIENIKKYIGNYQNDILNLYNDIKYYKDKYSYPIHKWNIDKTKSIKTALLNNKNLKRVTNRLYVDFYDLYVINNIDQYLYFYDNNTSDILFSNYINRDIDDIEKFIDNYIDYEEYSYIDDYSKIINLNNDYIRYIIDSITTTQKHMEQLNKLKNEHITDEHITDTIEMEPNIYKNIKNLDDKTEHIDDIVNGIVDDDILIKDVKKFVTTNKELIPIIKLYDKEDVTDKHKKSNVISNVNRIRNSSNSNTVSRSKQNLYQIVNFANTIKKIFTLQTGGGIVEDFNYSYENIMNTLLTETEIKDIIVDNKISDIKDINSLQELLYLINNNTNKYFKNIYELLQVYFDKTELPNKNIMIKKLDIIKYFENILHILGDEGFEILLKNDYELSNIYDNIVEDLVKNLENTKQDPETIAGHKRNRNQYTPYSTTIRRNSRSSNRNRRILNTHSITPKKLTYTGGNNKTIKKKVKQIHNNKTIKKKVKQMYKKKTIKKKVKKIHKKKTIKKKVKQMYNRKTINKNIKK
jgi:hypothetical protein